MPGQIDHLEIPIIIWETADSKEDLEDWLLSQNPQFMTEMRRLRAEDVAGKFKPFIPKPNKC